jgi:hypothetical protein
VFSRTPRSEPWTTPQRYDFVTAEDDFAVQSLIGHVEANRSYYNAVLLLATDPNTVAIEFENMAWGPGQVMSDHVDPTPLDVFGSYVAFPLAKPSQGIDDTAVVDIAAALNGTDPTRQQWALDRLAGMSEVDRQSVLERLPLASAKSERLNSMSTRGVFAEGKLGHCNLSEEIDNTRFWKWEEHPIPIQAPDIAAVTPVTPTPQQQTAIPTAFPQPMVNIVAPTAAPDPVGLAAALRLLGTPDIFRDMSGRAAVANLLKKLSDKSISIAEAATAARQIQSKQGSAGAAGSGSAGAGGAGSPGGTPATGLGSPRTSPSDRPSTTNQDLQDLQDLQHVLRSAQDKDLISPEAAQGAYTHAVRGAYDPEFVRTGGTGAAGTTAPTVAVAAATDAQLGQAAAVQFFDAFDIDT